MKTIFKLLTILTVFLSSLSFAQTDCFPLDPIIKIGRPIKIYEINLPAGQQLDATKINSYLVSFQAAFNRTSNGEAVAEKAVDLINQTDPKHRIITNELVAKSWDFASFRENILTKLKEVSDVGLIEELVSTHYASQIVENSGKYNPETSSLKMNCILTVTGYSSTAVYSNPYDGENGGGIAGGGCTGPRFPFPKPITVCP